MEVRPIPEGSVEIQTGLWMHTETMTVLGQERTFGRLYSAEGYCFYWLSNPDNYDEEGNLKPLEERIFAQYTTLGFEPNVDDVNADYFSVPIQDGYEILGATNPPVTA